MLGQVIALQSFSIKHNYTKSLGFYDKNRIYAPNKELGCVGQGLGSTEVFSALIPPTIDFCLFAAVN